MTPSAPRTPSAPSRDGWTAFALLALATGADLLLDRYVSVTSLAMVYVLAVVVASYTLRWAPSLFCALAAVLLLDFLFVSPRYTLQVDARENLFALLAMLAVALV